MSPRVIGDDRGFDLLQVGVVMPLLHGGIPTEPVVLVRADGGRRIFKAHVQMNLVMTDDTSLIVSPGDEVERTLPSGQVEVFDVIDPGFYRAIGGFPDHFQMRVARKGTRKSAPSQITAGVVIQGNVNGGMVAGGNIHVTNNFSQNNLSEISSFIGSLRAQLPQLELPPEDHEELTTDLAALETQIKKREPKLKIVAALFQGVRSQLVKRTSSAVAIALISQADKIWHWLEQLAQNHS